jgi:hypothetical protein
MIEKEYIFRLRLPRTPRARWLLAAALGALGLGAFAYAAVPHTFAAGEALSAAKLNENFGALDGRVATLERGGGYCGSTAPVMPRLNPMNGYAAGAMLCAGVAGCGGNAHICSPEEMVRWSSAGNGTTPKGWTARGVTDYFTGGTVDDCSAFTSNTGTGAIWENARMSTYDCASVVTLPLHCCK